MENMDLYNRFRAVPTEALKTIGAGRLKGFSDINPMWRLKMLTDTFGPVGFGWKYTITEKRIDEGKDGELVASVQIDLFVKVNDEWSAPIPGIGGSKFSTNERGGVYTSDEAFKMALTDAISIACKALGMGADVYYAKDRTKYDTQPQEQPQAQPAAPKKKRLFVRTDDHLVACCVDLIRGTNNNGANKNNLKWTLRDFNNAFDGFTNEDLAFLNNLAQIAEQNENQ